MIILLAQKLKPFQGLGPLANWIPNATDIDTPALLFTKIISLAISLMTVVAFIWFLLNLFSAALGWLSDRGDEKHIAESKKRITNSAIGLIITISAIFLAKLIGFIFQIDILDLTTLIKTLSP